MEGTTLREQIRPMAIRIENARTSFLQNVREQFGKTEADATRVFDAYRKVRAIKLNVAMGRYDLTHGAFWNQAVIDRAQASEPV